ncbi:MAG: transposase [Patescibacteria group bacterium]
MPGKNSIKEYEAGAYYHIYNRGVEKRPIFLDEADYKTFLSYLKLYLSNPDLQGLTLKVSPSHKVKNYNGEIELLCYCLMPNHFHFLVKQSKYDAINRFIKSLLVKYSMYFNKKYNRVGKLFQGVYKAVKVGNQEQLLYLTRYIHLNPKKDNIVNHSYSSLDNYIGKFEQEWVKPGEILEYFSNTNKNLTYMAFLDLEDGLDLQGLTLKEE